MKNIIITQSDFDQLYQLVERRKDSSSPDDQYLETLEQELDNAEIVDPREIPSDIVTMNSEVRLEDLDSGEKKNYKLVFPRLNMPENGVSILAPIGTALLGYRAGDVIEWKVPKGIRRLQILEVVYQPESAKAAS